MRVTHFLVEDARRADFDPHRLGEFEEFAGLDPEDGPTAGKKRAAADESERGMKLLFLYGGMLGAAAIILLTAIGAGKGKACRMRAAQQ